LGTDDNPSSVQDAPCTHAPPAQAYPAAHSSLFVQAFKHPLASHANGTQLVAGGALQLPRPSHVDASTNVEPEQLAALQVVDVPFLNATHLVASFAPSHVSTWHTSASAAHFGREPRGSPETGVHAPTLPLTSQASHWPPQARSQQTPSMQSPEPHEVPSVQG
jgi:hypothetical protein